MKRRLPLAVCLLAAAAVVALARLQPSAAPDHSAVAPAERLANAGWKARHEAMGDRISRGAERGDIGMLFIGDSITQGWGDDGREAWAEFYEKRGAVNLGISGDRTQHVLWRLDRYDLEGLSRPDAGGAPRLAVIMIGTNNSNGSDNTAREIADGTEAIVAKIRGKLPDTKVLLLAIFPRGERPDPQREKNAEASRLASVVADGTSVVYLDIGPKFLRSDGTLSKEIMPDFLHLSPKGYRVWAESIEPTVRELLGEK